MVHDVGRALLWKDTIQSAAVYGMPLALYIKGFYTIVTFNCEESQLG